MRDNKIRVLRVMHRLNVGGPTYHAGYLTKYLDKENFKSMLISGNIDNYEKSGKYILDSLNVKVKFIKNMYRKINIFKDFFSLIEIILIINKFKPTIVHTHVQCQI